jgi:uncharacterized cupin superfamily protein
MVCDRDEVPERVTEAGPMRAASTDLGPAAGSVRAGVRRARISEGAPSTPAHAHDAGAEVAIVLAGARPSRQDGTTYEVGAGDALLHRPGGVAQAFRGGPGGMTLPAYGRRRPEDLDLHPRSSMLHVRGVEVLLGVAGLESGDGEP